MQKRIFISGKGWMDSPLGREHTHPEEEFIENLSLSMFQENVSVVSIQSRTPSP